MSSSPVPVRSWISLISSRIWRWIVTSRAVVGSSAMSSFGLQLSAIAIITRWRMPPDSSCGYCLTRRSGVEMPTSARALTVMSLAADFATSWWSRTASMIWSPIVRTGFRLVIGSWKIIAISPPRMSRSSSLGSVSRSRPSNQTSPPAISPGGSSIRRMIVSAVTLLPEPDSPTIARRPPRLTAKSTPSTALTTPSRTLK